MNITRDVILDLLPLYDAGEVSADTRALVDEFLAAHPEVARLNQSADAMLKRPPVAGSEHERRVALARTQYLLTRRQMLFALAIASTLSVFAFSFSGGHIVWLIWRDARPLAWLVTAIAIASWSLYIHTSRKLKVTGM